MQIIMQKCVGTSSDEISVCQAIDEVRIRMYSRCNRCVFGSQAFLIPEQQHHFIAITDLVKACHNVASCQLLLLMTVSFSYANTIDHSSQHQDIGNQGPARLTFCSLNSSGGLDDDPSPSAHVGISWLSVLVDKLL